MDEAKDCKNKKTPVPGGGVGVARGAEETQGVRGAGGAQDTREVPTPVVSRDAAVAFTTRAGVAREAEKIADNFTEEDAAVLERLQHSSKRLE